MLAQDMRKVDPNNAGKVLAERRHMKAHERIARLHRLQARVYQLEMALKRAGVEIPPGFE